VADRSIAPVGAEEHDRAAALLIRRG